MSTDAKNAPNKDLIAELKKALALAEAGSITDGVVVALGPDTYHRTFAVEKPIGMAAMIGELGMFKTEMELIVMGNRSQQMENRKRFLQPGSNLRN